MHRQIVPRGGGFRVPNDRLPLADDTAYTCF